MSVVTTLIPAEAPAIEHADALDWLAARDPGAATAVIYDPPYGVGSPVRGREDGAAGAVFAPFGFLYDHVAVRPGATARRHCGHLRRLAADARPGQDRDDDRTAARELRRVDPEQARHRRTVPGELGPNPDRGARRAGRGRPGGDQERGGDRRRRHRQHGRRRLSGAALSSVREARSRIRAHPRPGLPCQATSSSTRSQGRPVPATPP